MGAGYAQACALLHASSGRTTGECQPELRTGWPAQTQSVNERMNEMATKESLLAAYRKVENSLVSTYTPEQYAGFILNCGLNADSLRTTPSGWIDNPKMQSTIEMRAKALAILESMEDM